MQLNTRSNRRLTVTLHILAWVLVLLIPSIVASTFGDGNNGHLIHFYINTLFYGFLFYLSYLWIVPRFYFGAKRWKYFAVSATLVLLFCLALWLINDFLFIDREREAQIARVMEEINKGKEGTAPPLKLFRLFNYFYSSILIVGFSLGMGVLEKLRQNEKERKDLEKEKLHSELAFLKNQVSPHFFFNTLNNIYSLIDTDTGEARETVHKLSSLMRYLLYDTAQENADLNDEIRFMKNYVDLMKLRISSRVDLQVDFPENIPELKVPPLLFIPVIENAFKHGISYRDPSFIHIRMSIRDKKVLFLVENSIRRANMPEVEGHSGIGLENVRKRVALLFPGSHRLDIREEEDRFSVEIEIDTTHTA
ncbi:MAG: sensor histidine kinase [Bacteroidota bacterium]